MKKHSPLGWRKPDVRHYRFALPNAVWGWQLQPYAFVLLAYLYYRQGASVTEEIIAAHTHMSVGTVRKYLASLMEKGLVTAELAPSVVPDSDSLTNCFTLPNEVFLLEIPPSAFMVYAYLLYCENRRTYQAFPSYHTMSSATHLAVNTIVKSVDALVDLGLITVEPSKYIDRHGKKWTGNNLYTILPVRGALDNHYQRQLRQVEVDTARYNVTRGCAASPRRTPRVASKSTG